MEIKASLNNLRISPRKARVVANLIKGMSVSRAEAQLSFLVKKPAPLVLKLLRSAASNAKNNFELERDNLFIKQILVEGGPSLKRWLPRAMGRATPILKRTCSIKLFLEELTPSQKKVKKVSKPEVLKPEEILPASDKATEEISGLPEEKKVKTLVSTKPYGASSESKKRIFSRQTFGNIKKVFRRKSI
jgi:large subunit ribosomal protein L22